MPGAVPPHTGSQGVGTTVNLGVYRALYELATFRFHGAVIYFVHDAVGIARTNFAASMIV